MQHFIFKKLFNLKNLKLYMNMMIKLPSTLKSQSDIPPILNLFKFN